MNIGDIKGFQALLKVDNPYAVAVGCVCHSLALCMSNTSKEIPIEFNEFVHHLYNMNQNALQLIQCFRG